MKLKAIRRIPSRRTLCLKGLSLVHTKIGTAAGIPRAEGEEALQDVTRDAGSRFDPQLIQVFADMREDIKLILHQ